MGLNSIHGILRNQILAMEPLPTLNRAYYLIQQAKKQRQVADAMNVKYEVEECNVQKKSHNPRNKTSREAELINVANIALIVRLKDIQQRYTSKYMDIQNGINWSVRIMAGRELLELMTDFPWKPDMT